MNNIQFIILTCDKYIETRADTIKRTWGKDNDVIFLTDSNLNINNFIGYDTPKNYNGIYFKYLNFFKNYDFTKKNYYFFTDDDTFVNLKNLEKLELQDKDSSFAICRLLCLNPDGTDLWGNQTGTNVSIIRGDNVNLPLYYPSGGSGFILSQRACISVQNYVRTIQNLPWCIFGDVSIGFWLRNSNVELIKNNNFWWDTHDNLLNNKWVPYNDDSDVITYHYVNEKIMEEYNKKYNSCL